jgi:hypothetical protein
MVVVAMVETVDISNRFPSDGTVEDEVALTQIPSSSCNIRVGLNPFATTYSYLRIPPIPEAERTQRLCLFLRSLFTNSLGEGHSDICRGKCKDCRNREHDE